MRAYTAMIICYLSIISLFSGCIEETKQEGAEMKGRKLEFEINKTEEEWKEILTPEQFRILRKKGTERAFTGEYHDSKREGLYVCAGCGNELFHSDAKFDSGTGWPSFWMPISEESIVTQADNSLFMRRTEVLCSRCGGHLGHVFNDGPRPTGLRYCMNSLALDFAEGKANPYADGDQE